MSVKLPQAEDYGARPSLRSNRIDQPSQAGVIVANSLAQAADTFTRLAIEKKQKTDRLNYSLAKQEIMTAELAMRDDLSKDPDYKTHDERYQTGVRTKRDEILGKYKLPPSDGALIGAETDYIFERGRIEVAGEATKKEYQHFRSKIDENLINAREQVANETNPEAANDLMGEQIESLRAAQERYPGMYTEEEVLAKIQGFVEDVSGARLDSMDVDSEIAAYEATLVARDKGGSITIEEIQAGKGSNSIADYLPRDEVTKRLELARKKKDDQDYTELAFQGSDAAYEAIGDSTDKHTDRLKYIKELYKDDAKAREAATQVATQRWNSERLQKAEIDEAKYRLLADQVTAANGNVGWYDLDPDVKADLSPQGEANLRAHIENVKERQGYSDSDDHDTQDIWRNLTAQEAANFDDDTFIPLTDDKGQIVRDPETGEPKLSGVRWKDKLTRSTADAYANMRRSFGISDKEGTGGLTQSQLVEKYLVSTDVFDRKPTAADRPELKEAYSRAEIAVNTAVAAKTEEKNAKLNPTELQETVNEVTMQMIYLRRGRFTEKDPLTGKTIDPPGFDLWGYNPFKSSGEWNSQAPLAALTAVTPGDLSTISPLAKEAFVPLSVGEALQRKDPLTGKNQSVITWMKNINPEASDEDLEEALFYYMYAERLGLEMRGDAAARLRLLGAEGY